MRVSPLCQRVESQVPGELFGSRSAWAVGLVPVRADQDVHSCFFEKADIPVEGGVGGLGLVEVRERGDGQALADALGDQSEGEGVADPERPFVDGVAGGRGDERCYPSAPGEFAQLALAGWPPAPGGRGRGRR